MGARRAHPRLPASSLLPHLPRMTASVIVIIKTIIITIIIVSVVIIIVLLIMIVIAASGRGKGDLFVRGSYYQ